MRIAKKIAVILLYLLFISVLLRFEMEKLLDFKQLLMVVIGMVLFYLPGFRPGQKENPSAILHQLGTSALLVSTIQTFVLLFILLQHPVSYDNLLYQISLNCRPMLYGFCFWIIFSEEKEKGGMDRALPEETVAGNEPMTAEQTYYRFLEAGLTKREAEIAVLVCKGLTNGEIAEELCISEATVKRHLSNLFEKLHVNKREQLRGSIAANRETG